MTLNIRMLLTCSVLLLAHGISMGQEWNRAGSVDLHTGGGDVFELFSWRDTLYVTGGFDSAGTMDCNYIVKHDGSNYFPVGQGFTAGTANTIREYKGKLYMGGGFQNASSLLNTRNLACWDGSSWSAWGVGGGLGAYSVSDITVFRDTVYVCGSFSTLAGVPDLDGIAMWNGSTWYDLGGGVGGPLDAMAVYKGELYVGGLFYQINGAPIAHIAKWDGSAWSAVGGGLNYAVRDMVVDSINDVLYVCGSFTVADGLPANYVAKWDGEHWHSLGANFNCDVLSLCMYHQELYAVGCFTEAGGAEGNYIARYDINGDGWYPLTSGVNNGAQQLAVYKDELYVGGGFTLAGDTAVTSLARWYMPPSPFIGVQENNEKVVSQLVVFPNPTSNSLTVLIPKEYALSGSAVIELHSMEGRLQQSHSVARGSTRAELSVSLLPAANYLVSLRGEGLPPMQQQVVVRRF